MMFFAMTVFSRTSTGSLLNESPRELLLFLYLVLVSGKVKKNAVITLN